ncbi:MAG: FAD-dependent oxidoreductase [Pseudomonadota bacterium]
MKIAVIGGGASGLCAAYKLQDHHEVHLFEKRDRLGGNIATLNGNVTPSGGGTGAILEAGVLGFHKQSYPNAHAFFDELGVAQATKRPTSALFFGDVFLPSNPWHLLRPPVLAKLLTNADQRRHLSAMRAGYIETFRRIVRRDGVQDTMLDNCLGGEEALDHFIKSLASLAFSTPGDAVSRLPVSLVGPYLGSTRYPEWTALQGGVWSYVQKLLDKSRFRISTGVKNISVTRSASGVSLSIEGEPQTFDQVIIAATPGQVLNILADPSDHEQALFRKWADHGFKTVAHTSDKVYGRMRSVPRTPMDLFVDPENGSYGYNTYMNDFYDIAGRVPYSFSYNLDDRIHEENVLHREEHTVPTYTVDARATIDDIWQMNGQQQTWFCGAWLGNGLHEGAISSAYRVAKSLQGDLPEGRALAASVS